MWLFKTHCAKALEPSRVGNLDLKNLHDFNPQSSTNQLITTNPLTTLVSSDGKNQIYYYSGNIPGNAGIPMGNYIVCQNLCASCGVCPFPSETSQNQG